MATTNSDHTFPDPKDLENARLWAIKAYLNKAQTKSMSSNHKQALETCDKALPLIAAIYEANGSAKPG